MNKKELFKNLNQLCKDLDLKYDINSGGCCYVAAVIAEQLENYNISYKLIKYDVRGLHYAIRVNDRIINRCDYNFREIVKDEYVHYEDIYFNYYNEYWNRTYNKQWNLIVKTKIKSLFKIYENRGKRFCNGRRSFR